MTVILCPCDIRLFSMVCITIIRTLRFFVIGNSYKSTGYVQPFSTDYSTIINSQLLFVLYTWLSPGKKRKDPCCNTQVPKRPDVRTFFSYLPSLSSETFWLSPSLGNPSSFFSALSVFSESVSSPLPVCSEAASDAPLSI